MQATSDNGCSGCAYRYSRLRWRAWDSRTSAVRRGTGTAASSSRRVPWSSASCTVSTAIALGGFALVSEPAGLVIRGESADDCVQSSFHYLIKLVQSEADAMVGDAVLGEVVGADLFAAVAAAHHAASFGADLFALLFQLQLIEPRPQHALGFGPVLDLR